jgi:hypothetical protein
MDATAAGPTPSTDSAEPGLDPLAAFEAFFRKTEPRLRRALVAACGPDLGRDAASEALAYAWEHWDRLSEMANLPSLEITHRTSRCWTGRPAGLTVARIATASRTPRAAVATSGIVYGFSKPDADACGADATPISSAAQAAQRRPARYPRAAVTLTTAAPMPTATSQAADAECRSVIRTRLQRVRSRAAGGDQHGGDQPQSGRAARVRIRRSGRRSGGRDDAWARTAAH